MPVDASGREGYAVHLRPLLWLLEQHADALVAEWRAAVGRRAETGCLHADAVERLAQRLHTVYAHLADILGCIDEPGDVAAWRELGAAQRDFGIPVATLVHALILARAEVLRFVRRNDLVDTVFEADERDRVIALIERYGDAALCRAVEGWEEGGAS